MGPSPPTRGPGSPRPSPACCQARCHWPFLAPSSPETQSVLCLSADSAARSHQLVCPVPPGRSRRGAPHKGDLGSGGQPASGTGAPPAQPRRPVRGGHASGPHRTPPSGTRPCSRLGCPGSDTARSRGARGPAPTPTAPCRGVSSHPASKSGARESPLWATPGRATRRRGCPGAAAAAAPRRAPAPRRPAGPTAARYLRPAPQPAQLPRAAPARLHRRRRRGPTAFCVPVGVGRSRTERQTRQPNRHRFYLAPPVQPSAAPIGGTRGGLPSNHRARRARRRRASPSQRRPRDSAGPGGRRVRAGAGGRGRALRDAAADWKRRAVSLFFRRTHRASQEGGGLSGRGRGAPRSSEPGRGGGNRPEGGTARSRRLAGTAESEFPGRRGGAGQKAKFEPVQNSGGGNGFNCRALFPARGPGAGAAGAALGRGAAGAQRPARYFWPLDPEGLWPPEPAVPTAREARARATLQLLPIPHSRRLVRSLPVHVSA